MNFINRHNRLLTARLAVILCVTLIRLPGFAMTSIYVDPHWTGAATGAAATPFIMMNSPATAVWKAIDGALSNDDVTVYFSALDATGTQQTIVTNWFIECFRNDGSNAEHNLTLDGYSYYNTSETSPSWAPNPNPSIANAFTNHQVFCILGDTNYLGVYPSLSSIGWVRGSKYKKQSNITVQGFESTGYGMRVSFEGDTNLWQYLYVHDITHVGPGITLLYTFNDSGVSNLNQQLMAPGTNIIIRNCYLLNTYGEGIYLGSVDPDIPTNVQAQAGNQHHNLEICSNVIMGAGVAGGGLPAAGGSGINTKNGIIGFWVHDNLIGPSTNQQWGIAVSQSMDATPVNAVIERNVIYGSHNNPGTGIYAVGNSNSFGLNGVIIRNNLIYSNHYGIKLAAYSTNSTGHGIVTNTYIYNNTIVDCDNQAITANNTSLAEVKNNLVISNNAGGSFVQFNMSARPGGVLSSDFNSFAPSCGYKAEGPNSHILGAANLSALFINPGFQNFQIISSCSIMGQGTNLSAVFRNDLSGRNTRPLSGGWTPGAYEAALAPPANLRIVQ